MDTVNTQKASAPVNERCIPALQKLGFQFLQKQEFEHGLVSLPAFSGVRISYLHKGISRHRGALHAGDLLLSGFTPFPLYGEVTDFSMTSIGVHFTLLYRLTGITPKHCRVPLKVPTADPTYDLLLPLFSSEQEMWEKLSLHILENTESKLDKTVLRQMKRVEFATKLYHKNPMFTLIEIASQMGISYRQLQRDFNSFLGMSPTEYERADRFRRAVRYLKIFPPAQASVASGYWDQAHMIRDFKEISGRTPRQVMQAGDIELPQLHIRGFESDTSIVPDSILSSP